MKKLFPLAVITITVFAFTSCKKNYTCTCSYKDLSGVDRVNTGEIHGTRSQARKSCQSNEDYLNTKYTYVYCEL